ncbi:hypothetical protein F3Y22_tig00110729pilonHSYRG00078 [Hibiscus syriacus]|uniref:Protein kinase domain-containing protein n=2 Tax=Hibiscus syriacus TaxID=106335 RepID=A0A6A2ZUK0_HIBSY|nr:hypothetical protein F3Y22_tig00110729pilonHSYRG00078 [Hibiscus syriacus]
MNHLNVESLIGFCDEEGETILVYEYLCNRSLYDCLHGNGINANPLPWEKRLEICIGAARGLHYLHTGAKYADLVACQQTSIKKETPVVGAYGYLDPEYHRTKYLSEKVDVYSFGVVLLEVIFDQTTFYQMIGEYDLWVVGQLRASGMDPLSKH